VLAERLTDSKISNIDESSLEDLSVKDNKVLATINSKVPVIEVDDLSALVGRIASNFYQHPSGKIPIVAITGTNGKTSCSHLLMQLINQVGKRAAVIGTLGCGVDQDFASDVAVDAVNTTPDAVSIHRYLDQWQAMGVDVVAMEASSHGLVQKRMDGVQVEVAVFTNLTRDHLDYHGTMQAYAEAKARLFQLPHLKTAVLNIDDPFAQTLESLIADDVRVVRYSAHTASNKEPMADVWVESINYSAEGVGGVIHSPWGDYAFSSPLLGEFNLSNLLAVISVMGVMNYSVADIIKAIPTLKTIAGRMEKVSTGLGINVVVDYAHTPDALEQALVAMRLHSGGKLWCVFGCGGDRDQGKRPQMGKIAELFADHVIVTSDNPRHEPADEIIDSILTGISRPSLVESDREKAIAFAIGHAEKGDSILIAGKGHEAFQQYGDTKIPFSDIKQARLALALRADSESGAAQ
jgi:UDP-N-acetylmuramoyl-L-alanyl-D-glutamate--2,6-diaminopimelate ligase